MSTDAQTGRISFEVANTGTAGNVVGWGKTVELTTASFNVDGNEVLDAATSFSGDVTGTYNSISVTNDSHTHDTRYFTETESCLLYTSPSPRDKRQSRMPSSA